MNAVFQARIAGQAGLATRAQALAAGMTERAVEWRLERGTWVRIHPGIYLTTPGRDDWEMRAVAALLHAGPGAALHRRSAGHAWGLLRGAPDQLEVVIPAHRRVVDVDGVTVTRSRYALDRVHPNEWPHRITAAHTVLDLSTGAPFDTAVGHAAKAISLGIAGAEDLLAALATRPRQAWRAELHEALGDVADGAESAAEVRYLRDVERAHGLPAGERQVPAGGGMRRDVEYQEFDVVVEVDGRLGHDGWRARQREGRRDRKAAATGRLTVRCHWPDLVPSACELARDLGQILAARGWAGMPRPCGRACEVKAAA